MTCSYCDKPEDAHYRTCPLRPDSPRPQPSEYVYVPSYSTDHTSPDVIEIEANVPAAFHGGRIEVVFQHAGRSYRVLAPPGYVAQQIVKELRLPEKSA